MQKWRINDGLILFAKKECGNGRVFHAGLFFIFCDVYEKAPFNDEAPTSSKQASGPTTSPVLFNPHRKEKHRGVGWGRKGKGEGEGEGKKPLLTLVSEVRGEGVFIFEKGPKSSC